MPDSDSESLWDVGFALIWPIVRQFLPEPTIGDPYGLLPMPTPRAGQDAPQKRAFVDYLAGPSDVAVTSLNDIELFLRDCTYVTSPTRNPDWTTLASHFETQRCGNCLDHSLWAWRKLRELGQPAEIVVGVVHPNEVPLMRHAWVVFQQGEQRVRMETIVKAGELSMLQHIHPHVDEYWPEIGVSRDGEPFRYAGMTRFFDARADRPWHEGLGVSPGRAARQPAQTSTPVHQP